MQNILQTGENENSLRRQVRVVQRQPSMYEAFLDGAIF